MEKQVISQEQMMEILETCYAKAIEGIPGTKRCDELGNEYLLKYGDPHIAAKKLINAQIAKCTTSGFITSLGGIITLPVAIPANIASVLYVQMRMIAALASIGGQDIHSDEVQTLVYLCLAGTSVTDICKSAGVQIATKLTTNLIKRLPRVVLTKINQRVGFRLITKFGTKGVINLGKMVPLAGGVIGGGFDLVTTKVIADKAYKMFLLDEIT